MNIAERIKESYDSKEYADNYVLNLVENRYGWNEQVKRITKEEFEMNLRKDQIDKICEAIYNNLDEYITDYTGYWVGCCCVDAADFGEQEELLDSLYNHRTGKDYNIRYLKRVFKEAGFFVKGSLAYYDMSGDGIRIVINEQQVKSILGMVDQATLNSL